MIIWNYTSDRYEFFGKNDMQWYVNHNSRPEKLYTKGLDENIIYSQAIPSFSEQDFLQ